MPGAPSALERRAQQWLRTSATRWLATASYTQKWLVLGVFIGVISGLGAVVFFEALRLGTHYLLSSLAGYRVGTPRAEGNVATSTHFARPWALPLVTGGGALVAGILVYTFAPDAEGHGTDAAIAAVHHNPRGIRLRTVAVKIVASALTIGSGGSGGREGPTGQISAGFGSFLARFFDLSPSDARLAVASGIGSGIGSIFGAPLAGAVLATEVLYRDDFEVEALLPAFIASIVGYSVWGSFEGFGPLFGYVSNFHLTSAATLLWFALIGVVGGYVGLAYAKGFYGIGGLFARLPVPRVLRPAIGGILVGLMGLALPEVLGTGYGWVQQSLGRGLLAIPLWIVLLIPFARVVATGFSIGSGGSGGIFGPGMVIGAFVGAAIWRLFDPIAPSLGHSPAPYVIVGMMACFGGISRAPLAVMLMVAEMTGSLSLFVPAMVAVGLATLIVRRSDDTIYRSQLRSRADAPAHQLLAGLPLLATIPVAEAMVAPRVVVSDHSKVRDALDRLRQRGVPSAPAVDDDLRYLGVVDVAGLEQADPDAEIATAGVVDSGVASVLESRHLDVVLESLASWRVHWLAVVDAERRVVGTVAGSDLVGAYRRTLASNLEHATLLAESAGVADLRVDRTSPLCGRTLAEANLPRGVLITTIERERLVLTPGGDTRLEANDRLTALGTPLALGQLRELAGPSSR